VGEKRFTTKTTLFKKALENEEAGQVLFRGIARALGYSQNTQPCEDLANNLPLSLLEQVKLGTYKAKQAWILGTAGLLPSQRPKLQNSIIRDGETRRLERIWKASGLTATMKEADWCFSRVRPYNFPTRRLVALSYILCRYAKSGLLRGILNLVRETPQGAERRRLERGLTITEPGYWANRLDFGVVNKRSSSLIGQG